MPQFRRTIGSLLSLCTALLAIEPASAACVVRRFAKLDVTTENGGLVTRVEINKHPLRLLIASSAFYSILSPEAARSAGLSIKPIPTTFDVRRNGKSIYVGRATIDEVEFGDGSTLKGLDFIVGDSFGGLDGMIGQNVLARRDAEYDLEHGLVRLSYTEKCAGGTPVYWAGPDAVMSAPIAALEGLNRFTIATVVVNGVKLQALLNSSQDMSSISPKALKKLGLAPNDEADGPDRVVKLDSLAIGDEMLRNATMRVAGGDRDTLDIVIGLDFFRAHHIYVSNGLQRMYFTSHGGPVMGVMPVRRDPSAAQGPSSAQ